MNSGKSAFKKKKKQFYWGPNVLFIHRHRYSTALNLKLMTGTMHVMITIRIMETGSWQPAYAQLYLLGRQWAKESEATETEKVPHQMASPRKADDCTRHLSLAHFLLLQFQQAVPPQHRQTKRSLPLKFSSSSSCWLLDFCMEMVVSMPLRFIVQIREEGIICLLVLGLIFIGLCLVGLILLDSIQMIAGARYWFLLLFTN